METNDVPIARRGLMFVLSSPSGAGKTTLSRRLLEQESGISMSISCTTRQKRPKEVHGEDYYFIDPPEFDQMVVENAFLEHAEVFGHAYGTPKAYVEDHLTQGEDVLFDIDWQGTHQLRKTSEKDLVSVFLLPPSLEELERRLHSRAQDSAEVVKRRMAKAISEISHWDEYDYVIVNQDLDVALTKITSILHAERLKRERQTGLAPFIGTLSHD